MSETETVEKSTTQVYPELFYMSLTGLVNAKSNMLFELRELEIELITAEHNLIFEESEILLKTDFKELGLTNEKMRKAYLTEQIYDLKCDIDFAKFNIESKKDTIEIINHLISIKELQLKNGE